MNRVIPELRGSLCAISDEGFIAVWEESTERAQSGFNQRDHHLFDISATSPRLACLLSFREMDITY